MPAGGRQPVISSAREVFLGHAVVRTGRICYKESAKHNETPQDNFHPSSLPSMILIAIASTAPLPGGGIVCMSKPLKFVSSGVLILTL